MPAAEAADTDTEEVLPDNLEVAVAPAPLVAMVDADDPVVADGKEKECCAGEVWRDRREAIGEEETEKKEDDEAEEEEEDGVVDRRWEGAKEESDEVAVWSDTERDFLACMGRAVRTVVEGNGPWEDPRRLVA